MKCVMNDVCVVPGSRNDALLVSFGSRSWIKRLFLVDLLVNALGCSEVVAKERGEGG